MHLTLKTLQRMNRMLDWICFYIKYILKVFHNFLLYYHYLIINDRTCIDCIIESYTNLTKDKFCKTLRKIWFTRYAFNILLHLKRNLGIKWVNSKTMKATQEKPRTQESFFYSNQSSYGHK